MAARAPSDILEAPSPATAPVLQIFADSADAVLALAIARGFQAEGAEVIGGALDADRVSAVVVIWSQASLTSPAMIAAARAAQAERPIIPISVDGAEPPAGFLRPAPLPLDGWSGDRTDSRWRFVLDELEIASLQKRAGYRLGTPALKPPPRTPKLALAVEDRTPPDIASFAAPARVRPGAAWLGGSGVDMRGVTLAMAAAALTAAFAFLVRFENGPPATRSEPFAANVQRPMVQIAPPEAAPAPIAAPKSGPDDLPSPPLTQPTAPRSPNLKPKPRATFLAPSAKPSGAVDPLAALIVQSTGGARERKGAFRDCRLCPPLVNVGPGRAAGVRESVVARAFALGSREVTFAEWDACVVDGGCRAWRPSDAGWGRGERPVINVSYDDALAYVDWLSARTGRRYRLPTGEEWTWAAVSGGASADKSGRRTSPVTAGPKDARGASHFLGNVWEWTADCARWTSEGACSARVVKGGAWNTGAWRKTPAHALRKPHDSRDYDLGFRVARDL